MTEPAAITLQSDPSAFVPMSDVERIAVYSWLSGLFGSPPTASALATYATPDGRALLRALAAFPPLAPTATALADHASADRERCQRAALDLAGTYARLFLGAGGRRSVTPHASVFQSERGLTHQGATATAARMLDSLGMTVARGFNEPPDHLAVLLAAMAERIGDGDPSAEAAYLEDQLLSWIGRFRDACIAADPRGLYGKAANSLVQFVEDDLRALQARLN